MRNLRRTRVYVGLILAVALSVAFAVMRAPTSAPSLSVIGLQTNTSSGHQRISAIVRMTNGGSAAVIYPADAVGPDYRILESSAGGWRQRPTLMCGVGIADTNLPPGHDITFEVDLESNTTCRIAVLYRILTSREKLRSKLPEWLTSRLGWSESEEQTALTPPIIFEEKKNALTTKIDKLVD